jgi:hypothetical protein
MDVMTKLEEQKMENLKKSEMVIYQRTGWIGNRKPCTNCGACGKNEKTVVEPPLMPPMGVTFNTETK